jgi:N-acetylneuraminic acid mutarotase
MTIRLIGQMLSSRAMRTCLMLVLVAAVLGGPTVSHTPTARATAGAGLRLLPALTADTTAPAAPTGVAATAGDGQVTLTWNAGTETDLAGYNIYRTTSAQDEITGTPLNGATPLATTAYTDSGATNGITYYYVVEAVDTSGNKAAAERVSATPRAASPATDVKVNFQPEAAAVPSGYLRDYGQAYGVRNGADQGSGLSYGWIDPATGTPLNLVGNGRERNLRTDQRHDTLMHMQYTGTSGVAATGAWEIAVPNDAYTVTVGVGDAGAFYDSVHQVSFEGQVAIAAFAPTSTNRLASATRTVNVTDGKLTIDAQGGTNTKITYVTIVTAPDAAKRPGITGTTPIDGATGVPVNNAIAATVKLPNVGYGVDDSTLTSASVKLIRASDDTEVPANRNTSGGGDIVVLQPTVLLDANTSYRFEVHEGLKDLSGASFLPYSMTFKTGTEGTSTGSSSIAFEKVSLPASDGNMYTSLTMGPDGKLYGGTLYGEIVRFAVNADGTLGTPQVITSLQDAEGGPRMLIGVAFDPSSTASNLVLWTSHSFLAENNGPDWTGKITRLSGPNLATVKDYVVGLPRSIRDHLTNSVAFGPEGALYFTQGSNSAMGAPDSAWGNRPERLLNAAVLRLDTDAVTTPPINVQTEGRPDGPNYDPFAAGAPLTIHATGIRNAYDLVWHSNGQLYVPTNGSASGGNTPGTPATLPASCRNRMDDAASGDYAGPQVPGVNGVSVTQDDFLFRVVKGGYYGHPNPARCEWVMNGGDPTSSADPAEVTQYPDGTQPDRNWRGFAFNFRNNKSPNGAIEYKTGTTFDGALKGKLLVVRYSAGDDIIALTPSGANLDITASETGIDGMTKFVDPLDLVEDTSNGNIYVSEFGAQRITLLRPKASRTSGFTQIDWSTLQSYPSGLGEAQGVAVNGKLYVFGGYPPPCCTPTVKSNVYDPATDTWSPIADLPIGLTHAGNATEGKNIYLAGGFEALPGGGRTIGSTKVYRYNTDTDTYTAMPDLPAKRAGGGLVVLGRNLHYFSGMTEDAAADVGDHWSLSLDGGTAWVSRAPLPNPRNHLAATVLDGRIYAVGGQHGEHSSLVTQSDVHAWDPATNAWTQVASLPKARGHIAASTFVMDGRIIVVGGETSHGSGIADVTAYDPAANAWTALSPLPAARISGVADQIAGVIYVATGSYTSAVYKGTPIASGTDITAPTVTAISPSAGLTEVALATNVSATFSESMDATTLTTSTVTLTRKDSTTPLAATVRYDSASRKAILDPSADLERGTTYTATVNTGARDAAGNALQASRTWSFSTAAAPGFWATKASAPASVLDGGGTALDGKVYFVAGKTSSGYRQTMHIFDPATNSWKSGTSLPAEYPGVENPAAVALDGKLYLFGGSTAAFAGAVTSAAVYDPATAQWTMLAPMPVGRGGATAQALSGRIYVMGGMDGGGASLATVAVYDPLTNTWDSAPAMDTRRDNPGSAVLDGKLYVFGGRTRNADGTSVNGTLDTVEAYDPATNTWANRASMPTGRRVMSVGTLDGRAQLMGGERTSTGGTYAANEEYNPVTNSWRALAPMVTPRHGAVSGTVNGVVYVAGGGPTGGSSYTNVNEAFSIEPPDTSDTTAPSVSAVAPADGETGVAVSANVIATFSEAMDATTVNTTTFTLVKQGTTTPVDATVSYDAASNAATLDPATDLELGAAYTARVTTGTTDMAGNRLASAKGWSFTIAATPPDTGGVRGEYYDNKDLTALKLTRTDPTINFSWGTGSPDPSVGADTFSARWTGSVKVDHNQAYTFYTTSNDGVRLWVNGQRIINNWTDHGTTEDRGAISLQAGQWYPIKLEYYDNSGSSSISLSYSSASTPKQVIPSDRLSPESSDTIVPTITGVTPADGATDAAVSANAVATFSEAMDATTVGASTFTLTRQGSSIPVAAAVTYDSTNDRAVLNPDAELEVGVTYTATVSRGVRDQAGNALAEDKVWSFTTSSAMGGLTGEYFDNKDLTAPKLTRVDRTVDFAWGTGSPDPSVGAESFSVRWTGSVKADHGQTYTFYTTSNDGVRLWVNGQLVINNWTDHAATENTGTIALEAGKSYPIRLEFYEGTGSAVIRLSYSSASTPKQVVPSDRLSPTSP